MEWLGQGQVEGGVRGACVAGGELLSCGACGGVEVSTESEG